MTFWHFTSSHGGGQERGDTGVYLGVFQLQKLAFQFCLTCPQPVRNNVIFLRIPRATNWAAFHENKRPDWFTRNSSCDHSLKIRSQGNPATFSTNQFPASFAVDFGIQLFQLTLSDKSLKLKDIFKEAVSTST